MIPFKDYLKIIQGDSYFLIHSCDKNVIVCLLAKDENNLNNLENMRKGANIYKLDRCIRTDKYVNFVTPE